MMNFFGGRNFNYSAEIFFLFGEDSSFSLSEAKERTKEEKALEKKKEEFMHER